MDYFDEVDSINKPYRIPNPKTDPIKAIVVYYKVLKGIEFDNRDWDEENFLRHIPPAKKLLKNCKSFELAKKCLEEFSEMFSSLGRYWSLDAVVKHSFDWMIKRGGVNDKQVRTRFFDAVAKSRPSYTNQAEGISLTSGEMLNSLRNLEVLQPENGTQRREADSANGSSGK